MATRIPAGAKAKKPKKRIRAQPAAPRFDTRVRALLSVASIWYYWEQDKNLRFTLMTGPAFEKSGIDPQPFLGKTRWELPMVPLSNGGSWREHRATLAARRPFSDLIFKHVSPTGELRFISTSGQPVFDASGRFDGYRGISKDATKRVQRERRLAIERSVARILAEASSVDEAALQIIRAICEAFQCVCGARWRLDEQAQTLQCAETWGVDSPAINQFLAATKRLSPLAVRTRGLVRRVCARRKPLWVGDITKEKSFLRAPEALPARLHSAFAFPITAGARAIGAMEFFSAAALQPDVEFLDAAAAIGASIGQFVRRKQAEAALRASEEKYRNVLANMSEGYFEVDLKGNYTFCNDALRRMHGCTHDEMMRLNYRSFYDTVTATQVFQTYNQVFQTGTPVDLVEWAFTRKDGSRGRWEQSVQRIDDVNGTPVGFRGVTRDVTSRRAAEAALRASEEKHRAILENMHEGYFEVDLKGNYTFMNDAMCRIQGYARDELMGMNFRHYVADEDTAKRLYAIYNEIYRSGAPAQITEWSFKRKDGTLGVWQSSVQLNTDKDGKPIGFRGVSRDVTDQRRADEALRASEEKYRSILENMEDAYYEVDLKGDLVFFNSAFSRLLGYPESELRGLNNRRYQTPGMAASVYKTFNQVYRTGAPAKAYDWEMQRKDGGKVLVEGSIQLVKDASERAIGFRGVLRDVTARRQMEMAVRESEERFRSLTHLSSDWFWEQDTEHRFTKFEGKEVLGGQASIGATIIGRRPWELPGIDTDAIDWDALRATYGRHEPICNMEYAYCDRNGNRYYVAVDGEPIFDKTGNFRGYRGTSRDITARKREERLLALEHMVTRRLAEAGADGSRKTLQTVLSTICESEQWHASGFWTIDETAETLRLDVGWSGTRAPAATIEFYQKSKEVVVPADGLLGEVWKTGKPLWVADTAKESRSVWSERIAATHERSTFCFPAIADGKVIGVFAFASNAIREPDERLLQTANVIGNQVGQFLQRKQSEDVLRESESRFRALTNLSSDWYWEQDAEIRFTRIESRRDDIESARAHLTGKRPWETSYQIDSTDGWDAHQQDLAARRSYRDVVMCRRLPDETLRYISVSGEPIFDNDGQFAGYRGVTREITAQKLAEARIQYLATHDGLTDTPNRFMFSQLLTLAIESARRYQRKFAVLFIDLDRFKVINDTLGHAAGDTLLKEMSLRLKDSLRGSDVIARLGGDEFVVLLQEANEPQQVTAAARKLLSSVIKPLTIAGHECRVTASIGIAMYPTDAADEQSLMKNADMAMYLAKEEGKNNFQFYSANIQAQSLERMALESNLRRALEREEFSLHYQAKVHLQSNRITGTEALLRWQNPELGSVSPAQFIPIAEDTGLIVPIGRWVLQTACRQNVAWQQEDLPAVSMAVNLSARQFADEDLLQDIEGALRESGMAAELLELEITEGMVMQNPERAIKILTAIKNMGVRLAIDDFGTGYSSLAQLKRFPIDTLKVDRSFIRDIPSDAEDKAITEAIIAMSKTLRLSVVAEGVETAEQAQFLRDHGCDEMQGYYFSKPIGAREFGMLLREHVGATEKIRKKA